MVLKGELYEEEDHDSDFARILLAHQVVFM